MGNSKACKMTDRPPGVRRGCDMAFYQLCRYLSGTALMAMTGVRHFNVPSDEDLKGALLAANHQSFLDPIFVGMAFQRPINYLARSDLFHVPGLREVIRALHAHPVKRGRVAPGTLKTVMDILRRQEPLLVFPEGTRTTDGSVGELEKGVGAIAKRCHAKIIPVCIEGAYRSWPRWRLLPVPARVSVCYGPPLDVESSDAGQIARTLQGELCRMQQSLRQYMYGHSNGVKDDVKGALGGK
jgi:1-acyl-sn-glycerol-3-phosphate acyltransferase